MGIAVPSIDLTPWFHGTDRDRRQVAENIDLALQQAGFLLITGHGVSNELRADVRRAAQRFFRLPVEVKQQYEAPPAHRGWQAPGRLANAYGEGTATPPDLQESLTLGSDQATGDPGLDSIFFPPNVWPAEVPEFRPLAEEYLAQMRPLANELLTIGAVALGLEPDFFTSQADHPSYGFNINLYPSLATVGNPQPGQFRVGPHTDWGSVTILDRQNGVGGLQIYTSDGEWINAPYDPEAFTINIGDLLARWTGDRWRSTRHRVLPPDPSAPDEELLSLVYFYTVNPTARVSSLGPPIGQTHYEPVQASDYLLGKAKSVTLN